MLIHSLVSLVNVRQHKYKPYIYLKYSIFCSIVPVQVIVLPQNVKVNKTNSISLSCDASGFPAPSITWTKSGQTLSNTAQLYISSSDKSDAGEYTCTASNGVGQPKTAKAYVIVQCKSKFLQFIKLVTATTSYPANFLF